MHLASVELQSLTPVGQGTALNDRRAFPFTDQTSPGRGHQLRAIQSRAAGPHPHGHHQPVAADTDSWGGVVVSGQAAGLLKPSVIKPLITTIEATLAIRQLGALVADDQKSLLQALTAVMG
jgi:mRNA interferase MazF